MADWGPVIVAVLLFVLLSPGLLFQIPAKGRVVEFGNMQTSGASILVHSIIYLGLITIFLIAIGVHIYTGWALSLLYIHDTSASFPVWVKRILLVVLWGFCYFNWGLRSEVLVSCNIKDAWLVWVHQNGWVLAFNFMDNEFVTVIGKYNFQ